MVFTKCSHLNLSLPRVMLNNNITEKISVLSVISTRFKVQAQMLRTSSAVLPDSFEKAASVLHDKVVISDLLVRRFVTDLLKTEGERQETVASSHYSSLRALKKNL